MDSKWKECVCGVLGAWTGFNLGINMQCGGPDTNEKAQWFYEELSDFVLNNKDLLEDELVEWINQILFNDFDLILEDGSTDWVAESLLKCRKWLEYDETKLNEFLSSLPSEAAVKQAACQSRVVASDSSDSDQEMEYDSFDEEMFEEQPKLQHPRTVTDDEGWTTIMPRN